MFASLEQASRLRIIAKTPLPIHGHPTTLLCITRVLIRNILRVQTPTRHPRFTIITPVNRYMTPIAQIATPTNLDLIILIQIIKSVFDLLARHADRIIGRVVAGEHGRAAVVGKGRKKIVDDGVVTRGQDVGGVGCVEVGVVVLAVGYLAGCAAD